MLGRSFKDQISDVFEFVPKEVCAQVEVQVAYFRKFVPTMPLEVPGGVPAPHALSCAVALEGIKQGAFLWFKLNKFAWNKVGCHSSMAEPNLYTHAELPIVAAVFADDVAVAFNGTHRAEYLAMRAE